MVDDLLEERTAEILEQKNPGFVPKQWSSWRVGKERAFLEAEATAT